MFIETRFNIGSTGVCRPAGMTDLVNFVVTSMDINVRRETGIDVEVGVSYGIRYTSPLSGCSDEAWDYFMEHVADRTDQRPDCTLFETVDEYNEAKKASDEAFGNGGTP